MYILLTDDGLLCWQTSGAGVGKDNGAGGVHDNKRCRTPQPNMQRARMEGVKTMLVDDPCSLLS